MSRSSSSHLPGVPAGMIGRLFSLGQVHEEVNQGTHISGLGECRPLGVWQWKGAHEGGEKEWKEVGG